MIATDIEQALNEQINQEYCSWYFYRAAADYCHGLNLAGFSKWLRRRADKKLGRADRLSDFVVERRGHVQARPIQLANGHWKTPQAVLESALERERHLSQSVAALTTLSLRQDDHATHDLLERLASEQAEAEASVEHARARLQLMSESPTGLFIFDQALA
jgi:ferritin